MSGLFASGRLVDLILLVVAGEAIGLAWWHRRYRTGIPPRCFAANLAAGAALLLALRVALTGGWWGWISLFLLSSLVASLIDLRQRWIGRTPPVTTGSSATIGRS